MAEALYRKYRPQIFEDVVGQEQIERTIKNAIEHDKVSHAYLFTGPRGTGKTTTARLLAKALLCEKGPTAEPDGTCEDCRMIADGVHPDVYELDAASRTGVENVREEIIGRVQFAPTRGCYKVYIIDEVHMLSTAAFNALLKTLEEPPSHVVFILCTTDPQQVPDTIHSRCQRFDFRRISVESMVSRLGAVCVSEGVEFEGDALDLIAHRADGGMRNALTSLEQVIAFGEGSVTLEKAEQVLGSLDVSELGEIVKHIGTRDVAACFRWTADFVETGADLARFTRDLAEHLRNMYVMSVAGEGVALDVSEAVRRELAGELPLFGPDRLARALGVLGDLMIELKTSANQRLSFEIALTRLVRPDSDLTLEALAERIEALEAGYSSVAHVMSATPAGAAFGGAAGASAGSASMAAGAAADGIARAASGGVTAGDSAARGAAGAGAGFAGSGAAGAVAAGAGADGFQGAAAPGSGFGGYTDHARGMEGAGARQAASTDDGVRSSAGAVERAASSAAAGWDAGAGRPAAEAAVQAGVAAQVPNASRASAQAQVGAATSGSPAQASPAAASGGAAGAGLESVPVQLLDSMRNPAGLQRMWQAALAQLKKTKAAYGVLFLNTKAVLDEAAGALVVEFPAENDFAFRAVQKPEVQDELAGAIVRSFGAAVPFRLSKAGQTPTATYAQAGASSAAASTQGAGSFGGASSARSAAADAGSAVRGGAGAYAAGQSGGTSAAYAQAAASAASSGAQARGGSAERAAAAEPMPWEEAPASHPGASSASVSSASGRGGAGFGQPQGQQAGSGYGQPQGQQEDASRGRAVHQSGVSRGGAVQQASSAPSYDYDEVPLDVYESEGAYAYDDPYEQGYGSPASVSSSGAQASAGHAAAASSPAARQPSAASAAASSAGQPSAGEPAGASAGFAAGPAADTGSAAPSASVDEPSLSELDAMLAFGFGEGTSFTEVQE